MKRGIVALLFVFHFSTVFAADPEIKKDFQPGFGEPVGSVVTAEGEAVIIHADMEAGYKAEANLPLYKGDTIITRESARLTFRLKDGSAMSLASNTKLTINESIYNPDAGDRSSFLNMAFGKARFWVKKVAGFKRKGFKVKTRTAVLGVRGSDFVVDAQETISHVSALEDTNLSLTLFRGCGDADDIKTDDCESRQLTLTDFQKASIEKDALEAEIRKLTPDEIKKINTEFPAVPPSGETTDQGGVYYSGDSYAKPAISESPETAPVVDANEDFGMIEDEIADDFEFSTESLPDYPYEPD